MAAKRKKRKQNVVLEELIREEMLEEFKETEKRLEGIREAMAKTKPDMDEIREAIEEAKSTLDRIGEFDMGLEEEEYTIRLSRHVTGKIRYDPYTGKIVIVLPDDTLWRQTPDGRWDERSLNMHINAMVQLLESRQLAQWREE